MPNEASLPKCTYGSLCYRKTEEHFRKFSHPRGHKMAKLYSAKGQKDGSPSKRSRETKDEETKPDTGDNEPLSGEDEGNDKKRARVSEDEKPTEAVTTAAESTADATDGNPPRLSPLLNSSFTESDKKQWLEELERLYSLQFPASFLDVWELAVQVSPNNPCHAFKDDIGVVLCGPYDILNGTFHNTTRNVNYHAHSRFVYDPPEVLTIMQHASGRHWALFRDDPTSLPIGVYEGSAEKPIFSPVDDTVLGAIEKIYGKKQTKIRADLTAFAENVGSYPKGVRSSKKVKARERQISLRTPSKLGVPKSIPWRDLPIHEADLVALLARIRKDKGTIDSDLDELGDALQWSDISNDEGDFGMGLCIGQYLFANSAPYPEDDSENPLWKSVERSLGCAYMLLGYSVFEEILGSMASYRSLNHNPHKETP